MYSYTALKPLRRSGDCLEKSNPIRIYRNYHNVLGKCIDTFEWEHRMLGQKLSMTWDLPGFPHDSSIRSTVSNMYICTGIHMEEGHTGFLHLPSAVLAIICITTSDKDSAVPFPRRT